MSLWKRDTRNDAFQFRIRFHSNFKFNLKSVWRKKSDKPNLTASFFIVFSFDVHPRRTFSQYISQKKIIKLPHSRYWPIALDMLCNRANL